MAQGNTSLMRFKADFLFGTLTMQRVKSECQVVVGWARSHKSKRTQQNYETLPSPFKNGKAVINQALSFELTMAFETDKKAFSQTEKIELVVYLKSEKSNKVAGKIIFDPNTLKQPQQIVVNLKDCPVQAKMETKARLIFLKKLNDDEISESSLSSAFKKKKAVDGPITSKIRMEQVGSVSSQKLPKLERQNIRSNPAMALGEGGRSDKERRRRQLMQEIRAKEKENGQLKKKLELQKENDGRDVKQIAKSLVILESENEELREQIKTLENRSKSMERQLKKYNAIEDEIETIQNDRDILRRRTLELEDREVHLSNQLATLLVAISQHGGAKLLDKMMLAIGVKQY